MCRIFALLVAVLYPAMPASAGPFDVPIDPTLSSMEVELCITGSCDTDSSPVAGHWTIDLDSIELPGEITLYDFDMQATQDLNHHISFGFLGQFDSTMSGLRVYYALPGTPMGPVPVIADGFSFFNVPTLMEGALTYDATGVVCVALQGSGLPCSDTRNLADEGEQIVDEVTGTVTSQDRIVVLQSSVFFQSPIDPANPDLGTITVTGNIHGEVYVPAPGDIDGDGDVDLGDFTIFAACFGLTAPNPPSCPADAFVGSDLDGDGEVTLADFVIFAGNFGT